MEFFKNHYEKIVLGLMLLLMASGAVLLVVEAGSVQDRLKDYRGLTVDGNGKPPPTQDMETMKSLLNRATQPSQTDFANVHRLFNPMAWYVDTNGNLIAGTKVGVSQLAVHSITPQRLLLELVSMGGTPDRPFVLISMTKEPLQAKTRKTFFINATNTAAIATIANPNTLDLQRKLVLLVREAAGTPENPEVKCELHEPGKDGGLKFNLTKAQGPVSVMVEYIANIQYLVETNFAWPKASKDKQLIFAGDTNIVVEVTASNVVIKAVSNDKLTTLPLGPPQPALVPGKK